jgi:Berberine and berberine like
VGRGYLNFEESAAGSRSFFDEVTHRHLRRIKAQVDPGDSFMSNHPILPAEQVTFVPEATR